MLGEALVPLKGEEPGMFLTKSHPKCFFLTRVEKKRVMILRTEHPLQPLGPMTAERSAGFLLQTEPKRQQGWPW